MPDSGERRAQLAALGRAVRRMREQKGMSVEQLAEAAGTTRQGIEALESGRLDPTYELLVAVAEGLRRQPSALVTLAEQLGQSREA